MARENWVRNNPYGYTETAFSIPDVLDNSKISLEAFRVYGHLSRIEDFGNTAWQDAEGIALACGMKLRRVIKGLRELERLSAITITEIRKNGKIVGGGISVNHCEEL